MKLFKENAEEIKVVDAVGPVFDLTAASLDTMYAEASVSSAFLLMLYDNDRVPYSQRIKRESFVNFYKQALAEFPTIGTFETYLFILRSVFGVESQILFGTPSPGTLEITLNLVNELTYNFIGYDAGGEFGIETQDGLSTLSFRVLSGFESDHDVELLFSEMIPIGIVPTYFINFYDYSNFIAYDSLGTYDMVDESANQLVFYEIGA